MLARARFAGMRITSGEEIGNQVLGFAPARLAADNEWVFVFRFGVIVSIGVDESWEREQLPLLRNLVREPFDQDETEELRLTIDPGRAEGVDHSGQVNLGAATPERLEVLAHVLAKSTVLSYFEKQTAQAFEQVERLATQLREGRSRPSDKALLNQIGEVLLIEARTVGRVEVTEKPEVAWDLPDVDRLYVRLAAEFELVERDRNLARKLSLISSVAQRYLDLQNTRRSLRVEWYIVLLILFEIVLTFYELWFH